MRRGEAVLLGTASVVFLAGCAFVGLGLAETGATQDTWMNVWFDFGLPLLVLAIAMGAHAVAMVHVRTLPPAANGSDGPNREIPGALPLAGAAAPGRLARVPVGRDARGRLACETTTARSRLMAQRLSERPPAD